MLALTHGDCIKALQAMPENSVDAIVTDPPYGLSDFKPKHVAEALTAWLAGEPYLIKKKGFMGRSWDAFVPGPEVWRECLRVLKPGGYLACFAGARTVDMMGIAIRLAGFDIRDELQWIYAQGMTKGPDVSKAIDKKLGNERPVVGERTLTGSAALTTAEKGGTYGAGTDSIGVPGKVVDITTPGSEESAPFDGYRTGLRPSHEPIILARKPFKGTLAENVLRWGTGALNAPGCAIATTDNLARKNTANGEGFDENNTYGVRRKADTHGRPEGRLPANVIFDEGAAAMLDEQSGTRKGMSGGGKHKPKPCPVCDGSGEEEFSGGPHTWWEKCSYCGGKKVVPYDGDTIAGGGHDGDDPRFHRGGKGGASMFFFCPKASRKEREAGLEAIEPAKRNDGRKKDIDNPYLRQGARRNDHPTVKPIEVIRWLVRLVRPPFEVVGQPLIVDPFMGSGTTGIAAVLEQCAFAGMELDERSLLISAHRIAHAMAGGSFA